jgi:long-chain acyl-CoA synthetase
MKVHDFTIYDIISRNAQLYPQRDCIIFNDIRLSHQEFKERCDRLAAGLVKFGIAQGDRLAIVAHNSDEYMIVYGAAARIGAIVLPVNCRFQPEEMEYVLNDGSPRLVFAGSDFLPTVSTLAKKIESIEACYTIGGGEASEGFQRIEDLYRDSGSAEELEISGDSGFVIIHTAAVAGHPRGALLSQHNITAINLGMILQFGLNPEDCHISHLPLYHIAGLSVSTAVMHAGGANVICSTFDPESTLRLIEKEKGTLFFNFPPILKMMIDKYEEQPCDVKSIRHIAGLDHPDNIQRFLEFAPEARFWTGFGQTEAMGVSGGLIDEKPGSTGKPSLTANVALFDDCDEEVPVGSPGEICVRGPAVFLGYWNLEDDTAYAFRNGWHHTGDIGRFDEDGYLWYVKRKAEKELIKPGGENVYPAEVEKVILTHAAVNEVSVIGVPDQKWGEAIKAVCSLKAGQTLPAEELIEYVASKIARYKKPQQVVFVDTLPKTDEGEIDRDQVKKDHGGKY